MAQPTSVPTPTTGGQSTTTGNAGGALRGAARVAQVQARNDTRTGSHAGRNMGHEAG